MEGRENKLIHSRIFPKFLRKIYEEGKVPKMKMYLMTPGPTPVAPETQLAMAQPIIHHRSPQFMEILGEVREGLKYLFQTEQEVLMFTATGTGAMEGVGDQHPVAPAIRPWWWTAASSANAGPSCATSTGSRWIAWRWNGAGRWIPRPWPRCLDANPEIKAVFVQANETSTGVQHPVKELAAVTKSRPGHHPGRGRHFGPGRLSPCPWTNGASTCWWRVRRRP